MIPIRYSLTPAEWAGKNEWNLGALWNSNCIDIMCEVGNEYVDTLFWMWASGAITEKEFQLYLKPFGLYSIHHRRVKKLVEDVKNE